jgi:hypothetical protein
VTTETHKLIVGAGKSTKTFVIKFDVRPHASRFIVVDEASMIVVAKGLIDRDSVVCDTQSDHHGEQLAPLESSVEIVLKLLWQESQVRQLEES